MNFSTAVFAIDDNVRAVRVRYDPEDVRNADVVYKTFDTTISVDDLVVVPTKSRVGMTVAKVIEVDVNVDLDNHGAEMKWIIQKVDAVAHDKVVEQEALIIETIRTADMKKRKAAMRDALFEGQEELLQGLKLISSDPAHPEASAAAPKDTSTVQPAGGWGTPQGN